MKKRIFAVLLVICVMFGTASSTTLAAEQINETRPPLGWTYLATVSNNVTVSGSTAYPSVVVTARSSVTKITMYSELQKSSSGIYKTVKTYSKTFNSSSGSYGESYAGGSGSYRLVTTVKTYSGDLFLESTTVTAYS